MYCWRRWGPAAGLPCSWQERGNSRRCTVGDTRRGPGSKREKEPECGHSRLLRRDSSRYGGQRSPKGLGGTWCASVVRPSQSDDGPTIKVNKADCKRWEPGVYEDVSAGVEECAVHR